jgi:hypothetical protein
MSRQERTDRINKFDHIGICVTDFARSKDFYGKALRPLSISLMSEFSAAQSGKHAHAGFVLDPNGNNVEALCHGPE